MGGLAVPFVMAKDKKPDPKVVVRCIEPVGIRSPVMALNKGDVIALEAFLAQNLIDRGYAEKVVVHPKETPEHRDRYTKPISVEQPEGRERATETRETKPIRDFVKK